MQNRVRMRLGNVVAETADPAASLEHWLVVSPIANSNTSVLLYQFDFSRDLDHEDYPSPEDIKNHEKSVFPSLDELLEYLDAEGVDTAGFDYPWNLEFPG